jgi:hypothetical protein
MCKISDLLIFSKCMQSHLQNSPTTPLKFWNPKKTFGNPSFLVKSEYFGYLGPNEKFRNPRTIIQIIQGRSPKLDSS